MRQLMGNELTRRGNSAAAIEQYREAIKIDPHLPGVHFQLAETLKASPSAADQAAAEAEYERALAENPTDVRSICRLSEYALGRSDFKGALARYIRAVELQPRDEEANLGVARVLMQTGQSPKANPFSCAPRRQIPPIRWCTCDWRRCTGNRAGARLRLGN
jgi:cytochrome c-type biogenesis protein CcmH/NrfG